MEISKVNLTLKLGAGITFYENNHLQNPNLVYGEGLRVPNVGGNLELDGLMATGALGKKKGFDRVILV